MRGGARRRRRGPLRRLTTLGRVLVALGAALLLAAGIAWAAAPSADPVGAMVGYMQRAQNMDGGFGGTAGAASDPGFSAWVAIALAAAGVNPRDQGRPGGRAVYDYLLAHAHELDLTTDFERVGLVAHAAQAPLRDFGGIDLVQRILARQNPDGSFHHTAGGGAGGVNDTIWAILSLVPVGEPAVRARLEPATDWILDAQNADGGWPAVMRGAPTDLDMTGAAIQALNAIGRRGTDAQRRAFELLREAQLADGGFPAVLADRESNTATTSWVVQGIWCAGGDPRDWDAASGRDPLDYLAAMQRADGSIAWKPSRDVNPLWMTAYAAPAYAGVCHPMENPPRSVGGPPPAPPEEQDPGPQPPQQPAPGTGGDGGGDPAGGGAALAGGGGRGAPLFSKPRPQSRGRRRDGVRRVHEDARGRRRATRAQRRAADAVRERTAAARGQTGGVTAGGTPSSDTPPSPSTPTSAGTPPASAPWSPAAADAPPDPLAGAGSDDAGAVATPDAPDRAGGAGGTPPATGAGEGSGGGPGGADEVTGRLIGEGETLPVEQGVGDDLAAAPGIRGARAGGQTEPAVALGLTGLLLLAAGFGTQLERQRPEKELFA